MTNEQEQHLLQIQKTFNKLVDSKYRKGQEEHGGNLYDLPFAQLLDNAIDEAIDQVVYLITLRDNLITNYQLTEKLRFDDNGE